MTSPLLALSLSLIGVFASVPAPSQSFAPAQEAGETDADYEAAVAAVEEANIAVNNDPEANLPLLSEAIERLSIFGPRIAANPEGRDALDLSLLNLARGLLLTGDEARAAEVMDQVIRSAHGRELPVERFGPTLADFHDERRELLEGQGTAAIQVQCQVSCRVVIDAQAATTDSGPLYLGGHRVWVESVDGSAAPERHEVELSEAGTTTVLHYPAAPAELPACAPVERRARPVAAKSEPKRILPRWAEISVAVIGAGAVAAGGVLLGLDGKCPGGLDPIADAQECPELYEGTVPGLVAVGVGSALLVAGAVTLSVDEVRVNNQRGRQAMLTWQMRF